MKVGDLVRYCPFHQAKLSKSGLVGLVLDVDTFLYLEKVYVKWSHSRPQGNPSWEYIDELEKISENQ